MLPHFRPENWFIATKVTFLVVVPQHVSTLLSPKFHYRLDRCGQYQNWFCYYKRKASMINHHENHVNYSLTSLPATWLLVGYRNIKQAATCTHVMNVTPPLTLVQNGHGARNFRNKMFYTEYICVCVCVRAERKSITRSKCWIRVIE